MARNWTEMDPKYRGWSELERWREYGRLKREWTKQHGYGDPQAYDRFIKEIIDKLWL